MAFLKINKLYYKHFFRSILIVGLGLGIIFLVIYPSQGAGDVFLALLLYILCGLFGIVLAPFILYARVTRGLKYRRRFIYCLIGTIDFCIGIVSLPYALRIKEKQIAAIIITLATFLIGAFILLDIFFGKREPKAHQEYLSA
jgi:hypothetical protein